MTRLLRTVARSGLVAATLLWAAAAGCASNDGGAMAEISKESLAGQWRKITQEDCARQYPERLEFDAVGIYKAPGGPEAGALWHGGDFTADDGSTLTVQAANDAMLPYRVAAFDGERLTLEDEGGCRVDYVREG